MPSAVDINFVHNTPDALPENAHSLSATSEPCATVVGRELARR